MEKPGFTSLAKIYSFNGRYKNKKAVLSQGIRAMPL